MRSLQTSLPPLHQSETTLQDWLQSRRPHMPMVNYPLLLQMASILAGLSTALQNGLRVERRQAPGSSSLGPSRTSSLASLYTTDQTRTSKPLLLFRSAVLTHFVVRWATSGTLTFSDGTTLQVGALANYGQATPVNLPGPINTTSIQFTVNSVGPDTWNVGLSEFAVFGRDSTAPPPQLAMSSSAVSSLQPTSTMPSASAAFSSVQSYYVSASKASSSAAASSAAASSLASSVRSSSAVAPSSTPVSPSNNIAGLAKAAASTWYSSSTAFSAIDGVFSGYPSNRTAEWASVQKEGAWLRLNWPEDVIITGITLYDRLNPTE